jgi:pimeloyl-ACP methyl ester carboxylesterase
MPDLVPFRVKVPEEALEDLRRRLARTRWPDQIAGSGWEYGADLAFLRGLTEYWRDGFDWRAQEEAVNRLPQLRVDVEGVGIHVVRQPGRGPRPLPLLITHGWPGSFLEMMTVLPRLADPAAFGGDPQDAFDVVVPSLPGYGFSDRPAAPGMSNQRIADLWAGLMSALGYERFGAQGGDWGAGVSTWLAVQHPQRVAGLHLNYVPGSFQPPIGPGQPELSEAERAFLKERSRWWREEGGYAHAQATRPQTLAVGLNDSPAGLLAWIVDKFRAWSDCGGDVLSRFTRDELLANVTLYWVTETIHSSMRLYFESQRALLQFEEGQGVPVPCGVARFPLEAPSPPREWVARVYDVRRWTEMPRGGHFAAMEEPELLVDDIRAFFRPLR